VTKRTGSIKTKAIPIASGSVRFHPIRSEESEKNFPKKITYAIHMKH
jgi:thioredoxin reductase